MDLLGLITGGLTATNNALNARDEGMAERRKAARDDLLARIQQEREDADASMRRETLRLQQESTARGMGYRTAGEMGSVGIGGATPGLGPMGAAAGAGVAAIDGMRRGPSRTIAGQAMVLDRTATPDARAAQQSEAKRRDTQAEIERRARETREQRDFTSRENALNRGVQMAGIEARNTGGQGGGITPTQRNNFVTESAALTDMYDAISTYRDVLSRYGTETMPGQGKAVLSSAYTNLALKAKEAAKLGALSGPDMDLINNLLTPPTGVGATMGAMFGAIPGVQSKQDQLLTQLDQYEAIINNQERRLYTSLGMEPPKRGAGGAGGQWRPGAGAASPAAAAGFQIPYEN